MSFYWSVNKIVHISQADYNFKMKKTTRAKKTNTPIPKAGAKSVDPLLNVKIAIEAKLMD